MLSRNSLIHGLRRDQLIEVLSISEFPVVWSRIPSFSLNQQAKPVILILMNFMFPLPQFHRLSTTGEWAPIDTILIEVVIPPAEADLVSAENDFLRDAGIGHIQCEPGGVSIRRTVTFVGGSPPTICCINSGLCA